MSKKEFYASENEKIVALDKLINMDEKQATMLYSRVSGNKIPSELVSVAQRSKTYEQASLKTLEYLWIGSKKANWNIKLSAKAAYLVRTNEHDHPRMDMLFTYEENMAILKKDEILRFGVKVETKLLDGTDF